MKYCTRCNKFVNPKHENDYGLCLSCYFEYLHELIDHMGEDYVEPEKIKKSFFQKLKEFFYE